MRLQPVATNNHGLTLLAFVLMTLAAGNQCVVAQLSSWVNSSGGFYETPSNWSAPIVPPPENDVIFGFPGEYVVGLQNDHTSANLTSTFEAHPVFAVAGDPSADRTYTVTGDLKIEDRANLTVGNGPGAGRFHLETNQLLIDADSQIADVGLLTVHDNASLSTRSARLGEFANTTGRVHVTGNLTEWDYGFDLFVGNSGRGELTIDAGATVTGGGIITSLADLAGSSASVNVAGVGTDGMPSTLTTLDRFQIGERGHAELAITGGALLDSSSSLVEMATTGGSQATVRISGADAAGNPSRWWTGSLFAGGIGGEATLTIEQGGLTQSGNVLLYETQVLLTGTSSAGSASTWDVGGELAMRSYTDLDVRDGAHLETQTANISASPGFARLSLDSAPNTASSTWHNSGDVNVGDNGFGRVTLMNGSRASIGGKLEVFADGTVNVEDSILIADRITSTAGGELNFDGGEIQFNRFDGDLINAAGVVGPGIGGDAATVVGDFTQQVGGTLALEIGGFAAATDTLGITGVADLDGLLELTLINGFTPDPVDNLTVVTALTLVGLFDNVVNGQRLITADGRGSFIVNYGLGSAFDPNQMVLSDFQLESILSGDYDGSGLVGAGDLDLVLGAWGDDVSMTGVPSGWVNEVPTGLIGAAQLDAVLSNWGASNPTSFVAVPEPSSSLMLLCGLIGVGRARRHAVGRIKRPKN